ncbi:MAG TPA: proton-conducting transporter membrane subunit [Anaeromyxobacter sp.]|nr:proton-conducting transporter membrane subunit [Anaeromyxobacter sp.]
MARAAVWLGHLVIVGAAAAAAVFAVALLSGSSPAVHVALPRFFPFAAMSLAVDGLSAFFLLVIALVTAAAGVYGPSYLGAHARGPAVQTLALGAFVASMALVCCAGDLFTFLLAWEGMTLASWTLVVSDTRSEENARAGLLYLVMAHAGTAALLVAFLALAERAGGFDFPAVRAAARGLDGPTRTALFMLALAGFGAKAGVVPLHVWLPKAHPAAPSHVSALMSGVMLKVAAYGIFRFGFDLLAPAGGPLPASWGWTVLLLGTASAVIGVLLALQQHDLKRLLAFHSVENVGIILIGAGLAMLLAGGRGPAALATLALAAALLHTLNHAAFKGLLFLGAGSVLARSGLRNMEELGGLARHMPWTAWLFLLGAVAISALPPLNGFVSEWMTFQALLLGGVRLGGASGLLAGVAASMLALTGGLAAACFAKAFGVTFLGRPRTAHAEHATESPAPMIAGMLLLAAACVALGLAPGWAMRLLDRPTAELLVGAASAAVTARGPLVLSAGDAAAGAGPTEISVTLAAALLALLAGLAALLRRGRRDAPRRLAPTWTCGMTPTARFDYTGTAFAKPLRLIFAALYRPRREIVKETGPSPYVVRRLAYTGEVVDLAETLLYARVKRWVTATSHGIRAYSTGRIHGYIAFVLVTLVVSLLLFANG